MRAIHTKVLRSTRTKGIRIKAQDGDRNSITIPWTIEIPRTIAHHKAAKALCDKMGWTGNLIDGWLRGNEYVFVFGGCPSCR